MQNTTAQARPDTVRSHHLFCRRRFAYPSAAVYFSEFMQSHQPSYSTGPNPLRGQTLKMIFPTICSSATQPTAVFRESTEVDR